MAKLQRLSQEQRENLAAYLDGELDDAATQEIEQVLASSEVARHEVDMLSRTWDMLSTLPTHKASEEFTQKTVTSLRAIENPVRSATSQAVARSTRRGGVLAMWAALLVVCGLVGFQATNRWIPNDSEQLLDDYPIIENLDKYSEVGSIEFLRVLKDRRTFADHDDHSSK
jgi:anti-sigma factor RsiW